MLTKIYFTRHGFRSNWAVDPSTGEYQSFIKSPTDIPSDQALTSKGVQQAQELASHLSTISPPIEQVYSSPFYRCIQTIAPTIEALSSTSQTTQNAKIRIEPGLGEWFGTASFLHPSAATPSVLSTHFPCIDLSYTPFITPDPHGETIEQLHDRAAYAMHKIIELSDRGGVETIIICTHAATLIAIGRALTGRMPERAEEEDFRPFTCGVSSFVRRGEGKDGEMSRNSEVV